MNDRIREIQQVVVNGDRATVYYKEGKKIKHFTCHSSEINFTDSSGEKSSLLKSEVHVPSNGYSHDAYVNEYFDDIRVNSNVVKYK